MLDIKITLNLFTSVLKFRTSRLYIKVNSCYLSIDIPVLQSLFVIHEGVLETHVT